MPLYNFYFPTPTAINALFQMEEKELSIDSRCFIELLVEQPSEGAQALRAKSCNLNFIITICHFKMAKVAQKNLRIFLISFFNAANRWTLKMYFSSVQVSKQEDSQDQKKRK
jgi:hypothetical protein